jgi:histidinol-phosphate aminotransferase
MRTVEELVRKNIKTLKPYSSARDEFKGVATVFLDANENSYGSPVAEKFNRYPDPLQIDLKEKISAIKGVPAGNMFIGNGSDEAIDVLFRIFCEPGKDNVIICPPTYGMYEVSANINDVEVRKVNLSADYQLNGEAILKAADANSKMLFICSPNNPTGNAIYAAEVEALVQHFDGIVVIDEAYINYSKQPSFINLLMKYPNVVILQTFSKAWGLAALRIGMAFAGGPIISYMNKVKPPYNVNLSSQQQAIQALDNIEWVNNLIKETVSERQLLVDSLKRLNIVSKIYPSDANFILVKVIDAKGIYDYLAGLGIVVRDRSKVELCEGCLRITIGTPEENKKLIEALTKY